jgi:hypothetical protein
MNDTNSTDEHTCKQSATSSVGDKITDARRAEYLKLLEIHNTNRIDYNVRKWETLKYFQSVVLTLLGATVVAVSTGIDRGLFCKPGILSFGFFGIVIVFPIIAGLAASLGIANLRRESALLYAEEAQSFKLAKLLKLDIEVPESERWLPGDDHLLMNKWRDWFHGIERPSCPIDLAAWVTLRIKGHRFRALSDMLFGCEIVAAVFAVVFAIVLAMLTYGASSWAPAAWGANICPSPPVHTFWFPQDFGIILK